MSWNFSARARGALLAGICAVTLAGCMTEALMGAGEEAVTRKHLAPVSPSMLALIERKGMDKRSPILLRIFKEESELEIWKENRAGRFELLKTYPICRWSGELGPKVREGDRQAPEGFYFITPELMNPRSSYYLAFNLGYPNEFDRAHGRTGAHLMVHGDCSSRGCYAMTDEQISEIFALAREAFDGGQLGFQVHAFPFRMTAKNLARHRKNPNLAFWRMLKEGNDHFELARQQPKIDICERRYVFNAHFDDPSQLFTAQGACPSYGVPPELATAVAAKKAADQRAISMLANLVPSAPVVRGNDGGTNPVFAGQSNPGRIVARPARSRPATANVTGSTTRPASPTRTAAAAAPRSRPVEPAQSEPQPAVVVPPPVPEPMPQRQAPDALPGAPILGSGGFSFR